MQKIIKTGAKLISLYRLKLKLMQMVLLNQEIIAFYLLCYFSARSIHGWETVAMLPTKSVATGKFAVHQSFAHRDI